MPQKQFLTDSLQYKTKESSYLRSWNNRIPDTFAQNIAEMILKTHVISNWFTFLTLFKKLKSEHVVPAGRAAVPGEICTARIGKCLCCAIHTPSTGLSCMWWLWWCWSPRMLCCASGEAELRLQFLQIPAAPRRSQGAEPPCWPCFTHSDRCSNCKIQRLQGN